MVLMACANTRGTFVDASVAAPFASTERKSSTGIEARPKMQASSLHELLPETNCFKLNDGSLMFYPISGSFRQEDTAHTQMILTEYPYSCPQHTDV